MKKQSEIPPRGKDYVYNKRLAQTLNALDEVRNELYRATSKLRESNDKLEQKLKGK
jgi:hypothetical protein